MKNQLKKTISLSEFARISKVSEAEIMGRSRVQVISIARQMYWYYLNKIVKVSLYAIAKQFGRTSYCVSSGIKTVENLIETRNHLVYPYREFIYSNNNNTE